MSISFYYTPPKIYTEENWKIFEVKQAQKLSYIIKKIMVEIKDFIRTKKSYSYS